MAACRIVREHEVNVWYGLLALFRISTESVSVGKLQLKYAADKCFNRISWFYSPEVQKGKVFVQQHGNYSRARGAQRLGLAAAYIRASDSELVNESAGPFISCR